MNYEVLRGRRAVVTLAATLLSVSTGTVRAQPACGGGDPVEGGVEVPQKKDD